VNAPAVTGGPAGPPPAGSPAEPPPSPGGAKAPPGTQGAPPPPPGPKASSMTHELRERVTRAEAILRELNDTEPHWLEKPATEKLRILHPATCELLPVTCPYDAALTRLHVMPGLTGVYECSLAPGDQLIVGRLRQHVPGAQFLRRPTTNGVNGARSRA
jgi:hypothetical protein